MYLTNCVDYQTSWTLEYATEGLCSSISIVEMLHNGHMDPRVLFT